IPRESATQRLGISPAPLEALDIVGDDLDRAHCPGAGCHGLALSFFGVLLQAAFLYALCSLGAAAIFPIHFVSPELALMLFDDAHLPQGVAIDAHHAVIAWIDSDLADDSGFGPIRHELVVVDVDGIGRALVAWPAIDDGIVRHLLGARAFGEALDNLVNQALV